MQGVFDNQSLQQFIGITPAYHSDDAAFAAMTACHA
jgi:hypothetical protein